MHCPDCKGRLTLEATYSVDDILIVCDACVNAWQSDEIMTKLEDLIADNIPQGMMLSMIAFGR